MTTIFVNLFALVSLIVAFFVNKEKTKKSLKKAVGIFINILPMVLGIVMIMGLLMGLVPKEYISKLIGEKSGILGILITAVTGSILHIPSIIAFPLAGGLVERGASVTSVAVFITTLTMIGVVTLPLEIKELGKKMAFLRNGISFVIAIIIGLLIGAVL